MVLFPFSPSLKPTLPSVRQRLIECRYQEVNTSSQFWAVFPHSGKNDTHTHVQITKYKVCDFSNSADVSNALIFAFNTGLAPYKQYKSC